MSDEIIKKAKAALESLNKNEEGEDLEKGKNRREQQKSVFGGWKTPAGSHQREKQMAALNEMGKRRYGMASERAPGKPNAAGKIIDKPTFDNKKNRIQHIGNPDSLTHEMAHLEVAPHGMPAKEFQHHMDKKWGQYNKDYGYKQHARQKDEYETTALENPLRRRAGLPAHQKETTEPKGKRDFAVDAPDKKIIKEVPKPSGKGVKRLTGTSENVSPEAREHMDRADRGEIKYHPLKGWHPGTSPDSKINQRAREKAKDPSRKDAKTLLRSDRPSMNDLKKAYQVNPELMSTEPTHTFNGVKVKVFSDRNGPGYDLHSGVRMSTAEIMEGEHKGKWTTVYHDDRLKPLKKSECPDCDGEGRSYNNGDETSGQYVACPTCQPKGKIIDPKGAGQDDPKLNKSFPYNPNKSYRQHKAEVAAKMQRLEDARNPEAAAKRHKSAIDAAVAAIEKAYGRTPKSDAPKPAKPDPDKK